MDRLKVFGSIKNPIESGEELHPVIQKFKNKQIVKSVSVNKEATVVNGKCAGISGMVVGANSRENTVEIQVEKGTYIITTYENISQ